MNTTKARADLQDIARDSLTMLADVGHIEMRALALTKRAHRLYRDIDDAIDIDEGRQAIERDDFSKLAGGRDLTDAIKNDRQL